MLTVFVFVLLMAMANPNTIFGSNLFPNLMIPLMHAYREHGVMFRW